MIATESVRLSVTDSSPRYLTDEFVRTLLVSVIIELLHDGERNVKL